MAKKKKEGGGELELLKDAGKVFNEKIYLRNYKFCL